MSIATLAAVELDRAAFVVDRRGHPAHDDVALRAERGVGVQAVDHGGDLQRQQAAAAAEDAFAVHAVAVVDAVADRVDVALQAVRGRERLPVEVGSDPVDPVVGERLGFGQLAAGDRRRMSGRRTAGRRQASTHTTASARAELGARAHGVLRTMERRISSAVIILACPIRATSPAALARTAAGRGALVAVWLLADPRTPDLAAQVYRVDLFGRVGFAVWDEHWYAGHDLPGYSLLFPPLGSLLGVRLLGALSVLASAALFERSCVACTAPRRAGAPRLFAVAAVGDVWSGRLAFALGVPFALAAVLVLVPGLPPVVAGRGESASGARDERLSLRRGMAVGALARCARPPAPSPACCCALAGLTYALWAVRLSGAAATRRHAVGVALALVLAPAVLVLALARCSPKAALSPTRCCRSPPPRSSFGAFLWALPASERLLRFGAVVYLLACLPACSSTRRSAATSSATACCWPGRCCVRRWARGGRRARAAMRAERRGAGRAVRDRGVGRVGAGARNARGGRQRIDQRLLLPPARALPRRRRSPARPAGARGGAADALALGGRAAGAQRVAGARLGEAARQPL